MEAIMWAVVLLMVSIQAALCVVLCVFLLRQVLDCSQDLPRLELNPVKAIKEHKEKAELQRAAEQQKDRIEAIMRNIDNYDGTGYGQEDV